MHPHKIIYFDLIWNHILSTFALQTIQTLQQSKIQTAEFVSTIAMNNIQT